MKTNFSANAQMQNYLRATKVYARPGDPTSPFLWGHAAKMMLQGGGWKGEGSDKILRNDKGSPRAQRIVTAGYEGEFVQEPLPTLSDFETTTKLILRMAIAGFTEQEAQDTFLQHANTGGAWWHFHTFASKDGGVSVWEKIASTLEYKNTQIKFSPVVLSVDPASEECYQPHSFIYPYFTTIPTDEVVKRGCNSKSTKAKKTKVSDEEWDGPWIVNGTFKTKAFKAVVWKIYEAVRWQEIIPMSEAALIKKLMEQEIVSKERMLRNYLAWMKANGFLRTEKKQLKVFRKGCKPYMAQCNVTVTAFSCYSYADFRTDLWTPKNEREDQTPTDVPVKATKPAEANVELPEAIDEDDDLSDKPERILALLSGEHECYAKS